MTPAGNEPLTAPGLVTEAIEQTEKIERLWRSCLLVERIARREEDPRWQTELLLVQLHGLRCGSQRSRMIARVRELHGRLCVHLRPITSPRYRCRMRRRRRCSGRQGQSRAGPDDDPPLTKRRPGLWRGRGAEHLATCKVSRDVGVT